MCRSEAEGGVWSASDFPCAGSVITKSAINLVDLFYFNDANNRSRFGDANNRSRFGGGCAFYWRRFWAVFSFAFRPRLTIPLDSFPLPKSYFILCLPIYRTHQSG